MRKSIEFQGKAMSRYVHILYLTYLLEHFKMHVRLGFCTSLWVFVNKVRHYIYQC